MVKAPVIDVMTRQVVYLPAATTLDEAAQAMRDQRTSATSWSPTAPTMAGMVTDRDIVVRAVAENRCRPTTTIGSIASREMIMVEQSATVGGGGAGDARAGRPPAPGLRRRSQAGRHHLAE